MAPEVFSTNSAGQQTVDNPADVYMFGCFLIEVLTGNPPWFWEDDTPSLLLHRLNHPTADPGFEARKRGRWNVCVHKAATDQSVGEVWMLEQLVYLCLNVHPAARPTIDEIVDTILYMSAPRDTSVAMDRVLHNVVDGTDAWALSSVRALSSVGIFSAA